MGGKQSSVCMAKVHTSNVIFFKEVAAIILEQEKGMLSLLKVCESCIK
jgi:hypothetical protein